MLISRLLCALSFIALSGACKSKAAPSLSTPDAAASIPDASILDASVALTIAGDAGPRPRERINSVDAVAVSSRVDNATEMPESLFDGDLDTAWSSKTGDLVGAWIAFRLFFKADVHAVDLTVGMTKTPELFEQNVRIAEVAVSWAPFVDNRETLGPATTLVDHFALDTTSRELQKIPVDLPGKGVVKITVTKIKVGTKPSWREASISEVRFDDNDGHLVITPSSISVGSFDPKPRGVLGIIPERAVPLRCLAAFAPAATSPMELSLRPIGSMWLVERAMNHASEGMYVQGVEAILCDLKAKHCTTSTAPIDDTPQK